MDYNRFNILFSFNQLSLELIRELIQIIAPLTTVVLTGVLVYLYKQQSRILDRQRELTEANQRALIRVLTYDLFAWPYLFHYYHQEGPVDDIPEIPDHCAFFSSYLSNPGKGYAENMYSELQIRSPSHTISSIHPLVAQTNTDQLAFQNTQGGVIAPEENEISLYQSSFWLDKDKLPNELTEVGMSIGDTVSPSEILWLLEEINESPVEIGIFIHYEDGTGVQEPIQLLTSKSELDGYHDITKVWRTGSDPDQEMEPQFSL